MKIIIIDDDPLVVESLKTIVSMNGMDVVGIGFDGHNAVSLFKSTAPDLVLMDIRMKLVSGLEASKSILGLDPDAKILLITTFQDDDYIEEALSLGCSGYILKQNIRGIVPAINAVVSGNTVFDSKIVGNLKGNSSSSSSNPVEMLSEREVEILSLVAEGLNNKEIARHLFLSEGTVRNYISTMLGKLDLRDRTQLVVYYYRSRV